MTGHRRKPVHSRSAIEVAPSGVPLLGAAGSGGPGIGGGVDAGMCGTSGRSGGGGRCTSFLRCGLDGQ
jgi:hypothetical protein